MAPCAALIVPEVRKGVRWRGVCGSLFDATVRPHRGKACVAIGGRIPAECNNGTANCNAPHSKLSICDEAGGGNAAVQKPGVPGREYSEISALTMYRIVFFDSRGRVSAMDDFDVSNDEAALAVGAERQCARSAIEIWHLKRLVGRLGSPVARPGNHQSVDFGYTPAPRLAGPAGRIGQVHYLRDDRAPAQKGYRSPLRG